MRKSFKLKINAVVYAVTKKALTQIRRDLWDQMLRTARQIDGDLREHLRRECGTTLPRFDVLSALAREPEGLRMSDLGRQLMVSNGNVTGIVDRLVQDGHVRRMVSQGDARATKVVLTDAGKAFFSNLERSFQDRLDALFTDVNHDDAEGIIIRLARVDDQLRKTKKGPHQDG